MIGIWLPDQAGGGRQSQGLGAAADELGLVEGEKTHIALPLGQIAEEKGLAVQFHLECSSLPASASTAS